MIGEIIRERRKARGLTQVELGAIIGKSGQVISNIERGYTSSLTFEEIVKLETQLGGLSGMKFDEERNYGKAVHDIGT